MPLFGLMNCLNGTESQHQRQQLAARNEVSASGRNRVADQVAAQYRGFARVRRIDDSVGQTIDASDPFGVSLHRIDAHKGKGIESKAAGQQTRDGSKST